MINDEPIKSQQESNILKHGLGNHDLEIIHAVIVIIYQKWEA